MDQSEEWLQSFTADQLLTLSPSPMLSFRTFPPTARALFPTFIPQRPFSREPTKRPAISFSLTCTLTSLSQSNWQPVLWNNVCKHLSLSQNRPLCKKKCHFSVSKFLFYISPVDSGSLAVFLTSTSTWQRHLEANHVFGKMWSLDSGLIKFGIKMGTLAVVK